MQISVSCPNCGRNLRVPARAVGKTGRCTGCRSPITIPAPANGEPDPYDVVEPEPAPARAPSPSPKPMTLEPPEEYTPLRPAAMPVVVTDIQMRFMSMVVFMVKWALAAIPAMIILWVIFVGFAIVALLTINALGPGFFRR